MPHHYETHSTTVEYRLQFRSRLMLNLYTSHVSDVWSSGLCLYSSGNTSQSAVDCDVAVFQCTALMQRSVLYSRSRYQQRCLSYAIVFLVAKTQRCLCFRIMR